MEEQIFNKKEMIDEFESLLLSVKRENIDDLLNYIRKTDFYSAPASTRYHNNVPSGLLNHSLNVYHCLLEKKNNPVWKDILEKVGDESIIISGLLHDLCKANFYALEYRNKKVYSPNGSKHDAQGNFDWESVPSYTVDDKSPYGHGEKSVMIITEFIKLTKTEKYAIRWHMGFTEKGNEGTLADAIKMIPFIWAIHEADVEATYLLEKTY